MPKPTPGASNMCNSDVIEFLASQHIVTDIEKIRVSETDNIIIAYVGQGIVNVKSDTGTISNIHIYSTSGSIVREEKANSNFITVNLSDLPTGIYIIKVYDRNANTASLKFKK